MPVAGSCGMLYFCWMHYRLVALCLTAWLPFTLFAQDKWGLRRCVEFAWQNNISIQQQEVQARIAALTEKQSRQAALPNANFSTNLGLQFGRSVDPTTNQFTTTQLLFQGINLNADIVIFNWHRVKNTLLAAQLNSKAMAANVDKVKNDIALSVATAYLQALLNKEQIQVAKIQFQQTRNQLEATRLRVNAGTLPELNAVELEAQLARDSNNIVNTRAAADISVLQLKALLNLEADTPFELEVPPVELIPLESIADLQPDRVYQLALQNQPNQKMNQLRLQSAQASVKANKASFYPSIAGFLGLGSNFANPFKKITGFELTGYQAPNPLNGIVNVNGTNYFLQEPNINFTTSQKSFGELWKGYGNQLGNNFRQNIGVAVSIPIFNNGGAARTQYERAKLDVKSAELTIRQSDQQLKQDIYQAYTNSLSALERYNASSTTLAAARKTYEFATKRYNVGLLGTFELINNQNNLNRAVTDQLIARYEYVFRMKVLEFYKGEGLKL